MSLYLIKREADSTIQPGSIVSGLKKIVEAGKHYRAGRTSYAAASAAGT